MKDTNKTTPGRGRTLADAFSAPFNWCDGRCERCPLTLDCPVQRRLEQKRWVHEARGENGDGVDVILNDVADDMASAIEVLRTVADEQGIDLSVPLRHAPIVLDEVRLRNAGVELSVALHALVHSPEYTKHSRAVDDAVSSGITLTSKAARIGAYLAAPSADTWGIDAVPNLLLVERVRARLTDALCHLDYEDFDKPTLATIRKALGDINRVLDPLIVGVGSAPRAILEALTARGAAPSPFCTRAQNPTE
jgi:hypothetical protein